MKNQAASPVKIYLSGDVGGGFNSEMIEKALAASGGPVVLYINSLGGDVFEAQAIVSKLSRYAQQKTAFIEGVAASAASIIAMAADKIIMAPGAMMMIHNPYSAITGTADEMKSRAAALEEAMDGIVSLYAKRTGNSADKIREWMAAETWMNARTAKERGFCDAIHGEEEAAPTKELARLRFEEVFLNHARAQKGGKEQNEMDSIVMKALGLAENDAPEAAEKRITALLDFEKGALDIADKSEAPAALEALGSFKALAEKAAELQAKADDLAKEKGALETRVAALEDERLETKVTAILDSLKREGRLVPAQEEWARSLGKSNLDSLLAFAASAPVIVSMSGAAEPRAAADAETAKKFSEMTIDEKAALAAKNRELYDKLKAQEG